MHTRKIILLILFIFCSGIQTSTAEFGKCDFSVANLQFRGTSAEQASCLLRKVGYKVIAEQNIILPAFLAAHIGNPVEYSANQMRSYLQTLNLVESQVGGSLSASLSRGNNNDARAPHARYFVVHDMAMPLEPTEQYFDERHFFDALNTDDKWNVIGPRPGRIRKAHVYIDRRGNLYTAHDLSVPRNGIKLEQNKHAGPRALGMFIHVELMQYRIRPKDRHGDWFPLSPTPGFTDAQYEKLALMYLVASRRAGQYLIPAFHAVIDQFAKGHDDPQHFELEKFDAQLVAVSGRLAGQR